jgi:hypothetical protein
MQGEVNDTKFPESLLFDREVWHNEIRLDEMVHVWHIFAKLLPEAQQAIEKIGAYVIAHTS